MCFVSIQNNCFDNTLIWSTKYYLFCRIALVRFSCDLVFFTTLYIQLNCLIFTSFWLVCKYLSYLIKFLSNNSRGYATAFLSNAGPLCTTALRTALWQWLWQKLFIGEICIGWTSFLGTLVFGEIFFHELFF